MKEGVAGQRVPSSFKKLPCELKTMNSVLYAKVKSVRPMQKTTTENMSSQVSIVIVTKFKG